MSKLYQVYNVSDIPELSQQLAHLNQGHYKISTVNNCVWGI